MVDQNIVDKMEDLEKELSVQYEGWVKKGGAWAPDCKTPKKVYRKCMFYATRWTERPNRFYNRKTGSSAFWSTQKKTTHLSHKSDMRMEMTGDDRHKAAEREGQGATCPGPPTY